MLEVLHELDPIVAASHELYRRAARLRRVLSLGLWAAGIGGLIGWGYLLGHHEVLTIVVSSSWASACLGAHFILTRWLPKRRATTRWFEEIEREYGVTRQELLAVSLGLEYHDVNYRGPSAP